MRRVERGLPLAEEDKRLLNEITIRLGYDPHNLPAGPVGFLVEAIADNILIAQRFRDGRAWSSEYGTKEDYERLSQKSGWRNDKVITQLPILIELENNNTSLEGVLSQPTGTDHDNAQK